MTEEQNNSATPSPSGQFYQQPFSISAWWADAMRVFRSAIYAGFHPLSIAACFFAFLIQGVVYRFWVEICRGSGDTSMATYSLTLHWPLTGPWAQWTPFSGGIKEVEGLFSSWFRPFAWGLTDMWNHSWGVVFLLFCAALLGLWSWVGVFVARRSALEVCEAKLVGNKGLFRFANQNFLRCWCGLLIPLVVGLVLTQSVLTIAYWIRGYGNVVIAWWLLGLVPLVIGVALVWVTAVSGFLFPAAVATDRSDAFETISRSFSYFLGRPLQFVFVGLLAALFLSVLATLLDQVLLMAIGSMESVYFDYKALSGILSADVWIWRSELFPIGSIQFEELFIPISLLKLGFKSTLLSLFFSLSTSVYVLLRRSKDEAPLSKIYLENQVALKDLKEGA